MSGATDTVDTMRVRVTIRPTETSELVGEAADYAAARDAAVAQIPDGWEAISFRVDRD